MVLVWATSAQAATVYVDSNAGGPTHDGSSWCNAFLTVQDALVAATGGTTIRVADGTYTPDQGGGQTPGDRSATFQLKNGVTMEGGYAGCGAPDPDARAIAANETILSGDLNGDDTPVPCTQDSPDCDSFGRLCVGGICIISDNNDENSYHVVTGSGRNATAVIAGFTISGGNSNAAFSPNDLGAGLYNDTGSPTVTNCTFSRNSTIGVGGGMCNVNGSNPTVTNCTFSGNSGGDGGGLYNGFSAPALTNCTFTGNTGGNGGGISNGGASPTVTNCTFSGNAASNVGGGMANHTSNPTVTNCTFSRNSARTSGGGMVNSNSSNPTVANCTFSGNSAFGSGGGMYNNNNSNPTVTNCTFSANSAAFVGGGMYNSSSSPTVANCILWGNSASGTMGESAQIRTLGGTPVVNYSIVQGLTGALGGTGNLGSNPLFVDADGADDIPGTDDDDLRLMSGSPAIDAADTTALPPDVADLDGDGDTTERTPLDLAGGPRVLDDPATADTGVPGSGVVDMGAYEFAPDCNTNGLLDECDLVCLDGEGTCNVAGCGESPDLDANGIPDECETGACCDGTTGLCADNVPMAVCIGDQARWRVNALCAELDPPCIEHTGACCDRGLSGGCTDGLTRAECACRECEWTKLAACDDVTCTPVEPIPTVNAWGLAVLTLILLTGAKLLFGRPVPAGGKAQSAASQ